MAGKSLDPRIELLSRGEDGVELWLVKVGSNIAETWTDAPSGSSLGFLDIVTQADGSVVFDATLNAQPVPKDGENAGDGGNDGDGDVSATVVSQHRLDHTAAFHVTPAARPVVKEGLTAEQKAKLYERTGVFEGRLTQKLTLKSDREREDALTKHIREEEQKKMGLLITEQEVWKLQRDTMENSAPTFSATSRAGDLRSRKRRRAEEKMEPHAMKDHIFACFAQEPHLTLKMINGQINQSEDRLKSVLKKYAEYHTSGEFRGKWQLKPEFAEEVESRKKASES